MEENRIRSRIFSTIIIVVFALLSLRLVQLQVVDQERHLEVSRANGVHAIPTIPARGAMFDRNGLLLVDNVPSYSITITPRFFREEAIPVLAELLGVEDSVVANRYKAARDWSIYQPSRIFRDVPFEVFGRIQENSYRLPGIDYVIEQRRRYQHARAAHAFGYVREITKGELEKRKEEGYRPGDLIGKAGLERYYEEELRGSVGEALRLVNVHGMDVAPYKGGAEDVPAHAGYDLRLSIDAKAQALAESLFVNKRGALVAIDPSNGEILAMVSSPDYDPNLLTGSIEPEIWKELTSGKAKPMYNRATMSAQPPGSTFKPFMSLTALQLGIINENTKISCGGGYFYGGRLWKCHGGAHGAISVRTAIQKSCNTFFFALFARMKFSDWTYWGRQFGFGQEIPLELGEQQPGILPDSAYFDRIVGKGQWGLGWTLSMGIGQGNVILTPMQLARYVAAVANKGTLHTPHLVHEMVDPETGRVVKPDVPPSKKIPIKEEYFDIVREGMKAVMEAGTGRGVQLPGGITAGGKTGTAQNPHGKDHSQFIMFAPWDNPKIAVACLVENGGFGAQQAAPIASLVVEQYLTGKVVPERQALKQLVMQRSSEGM